MTPATLIYQMGKVGSTSVNHALIDKDVPVLHSHWMQYDFPKAEFSTKKLGFVEEVKQGNSSPLNIITLIREPMGRNLSAFFQGISRYVEDYRHASIEDLQKEFIDKYRITYPDEWFEYELMDLFDFNPYNQPFNHNKGYKIYKAGKHKILIIRLEDTEKILTEAIYKFLGVEGVVMQRKNVFADRQVGTFLGDKYAKAKALSLPKEFVEKNFELKYAQHFYTEEERKKYMERWINGN